VRLADSLPPASVVPPAPSSRRAADSVD
jgi:hypothetical protein